MIYSHEGGFADRAVSSPRGGGVLFLWGLLRFPAFLSVLYLLRNEILTAIEVTFDYRGVTEYAISLMSTPLSRLVILVVLTLALSVFWLLVTRYFNPLIAYISTIIAASLLFFIAARLTETSLSRLAPPMLILATNLLPDQIIERISRYGKWWNGFMAVGIGVAELFFIRRYLVWLGSLTKREAKSPDVSPGILPVLLGSILSALIGVMLLNHEPLVSLEQAVRMPPEVSILDSGDFNWIEIDASGQYLFASGHGLPHLRRYDLSDPAAVPVRSNVTVGEAQGFAYDPDADEIYVYNTQTQTLMYFDASTLDLKRSLYLPEVSQGDPWIAVDGHTDTITIVSEADVRAGTPFVVLNRSTGTILNRRDLDASSILVHPDKPILYLSFSRYDTDLMAYDLEQGIVIHESPADPRVDRMAYWEQENELLLASPIESRVLRYDADSLELKGNLASNFGVRVVAVDPMRNVLLCGSLTTGTVAVFGLETGQQLASFYLGPWLRTIALNPDMGTAFVSANGALYRLNYGYLS